jgi:hypothetical protein
VLLECDDQRDALRREGRAVVTGGLERGAPRRLVHLADLVVAASEDLLGRLVVEEEVALGVDEEHGHREIARER